MDVRGWCLGSLGLLGMGIVGPGGVAAQVVNDQTANAPEVAYAPSLAYPFGRANPGAPPELAQMAFMVGEFDCVDEVRRGFRLEFRGCRPRMDVYLHSKAVAAHPGLGTRRVT